jgi:hypothetical protein
MVYVNRDRDNKFMCSKVSSKVWYARITLSLSDIKIKKAMFNCMWVKK